MFCATAFLSPTLRPSWLGESQIYENAQGGGTHALRSVACYIAISEALERWAFYAECDGPRRSALAFDIEPSTTGMAAFPGLTKGPSRENARLEAVERWSLVEWWLGRLPATAAVGSDEAAGSLEILTPFDRCAVALVWRTSPAGAMSFGFAAAGKLPDALAHARIEEARNASVLAKLFRETSSSPEDFPFKGLRLSYERRLAFFSSAAGGALFRERLASSCGQMAVPERPRTIMDCELPGPWTKYATVWRVLYEQSNRAHQDGDRHDFFLF
jgi:hypothetical protein